MAVITRTTITAPGITLKRFVHKKYIHRPPIFLLGAGIVVALAMILPLGYLLLRTAGSGSKVWDILLRPRTAEIFFNSAALSLTVAGVCSVLGISLAWLTTRTDLPGRKIWAVLLSLPLVIPSYLGAFTLVSSLGPKGIVQGWLEPLGIDRLPSIYGFWGAALALTLVSYPYVFLSVRAGIRGLDPALEEAARSLGKNSRVVFWQIVLPHLRPSIAAGALLAALYSLSDFGAVAMLQYTSFTQAIYIQYRSAFDRSTAAVLALMLVLFTLTLLFLEAKTRGRAKFYRSSAGAVCKPQAARLGVWRWPALVMCAAVVMVGLVMPVGVIGFWLLRGWLNGEAIAFSWNLILNSVTASGLAALVGVAAAVPVAVLAVRYHGRASSLIEKAAYAGYALPGIVIALSLVFFGANYTSFLYQTLAMLIFAYVVRFLPQAVGATRTSLLQISPNLEEAARCLGRSPFNTLRTITLPLMRSGLLTGAALIFLTAMKELPSTLLLSPTGFGTLATRIWSASGEAFFAQAAAPGLILLLVSGLSIMLILSQEEQ
jgi:iron(III) transport system permease protein